MIDKPDQAEALTMTRRDWVRVGAALAIRTYTDPRLQDLADIFGRQLQTWEKHAEDVDDYSMCICGIPMDRHPVTYSVDPSPCCAACDRFGDDGDPTARGCGLPDCPCQSPEGPEL
ncbi:hypothetical protein OR221_0821 [Microbacterium laevaniformans OR221]|nr:hypothetical protein OR221_0821 [Microbacterium laevaniformans OR221]